jgi:hypothetical protein
MASELFTACFAAGGSSSTCQPLFIIQRSSPITNCTGRLAVGVRKGERPVGPRWKLPHGIRQLKLFLNRGGDEARHFSNGGATTE